MDFSGDEHYGDDVTSGIVDEPMVYNPIEEGHYDDDPSPYAGDYSEE